MARVEIPADHPRRESLETREKIIEGYDKEVVATAGLLAHGRGEAFDYLIGERTTAQAKKAMAAAIAAILLADNPVISVNGNVCSLVPESLVRLSEITNAPLEINLFYYRKEREDAIRTMLTQAGAKQILGTHDRPSETIPELSSNRRKVDSEGIAKADVVLVPLEDGDRTEALRKVDKFVITIDLNPMSRTAVFSNITIVDNIVRAMPLMVELAEQMTNWTTESLRKVLDEFDNAENREASLKLMIANLETQAAREESTE